MATRIGACIIGLFGFASVTGIAFAQTSPPPIVTSLSVSPSYVASGTTTSVSWAGAWTASGVNLYFTCPTGIVLSLNGNAFPCNASQSAGSTSGTDTFTVTNLTNAQQYVTVTAYPIDPSGTQYPEGAKSTTLLVGTSPSPITGMSLSASTTASGVPAVVSWSGSDPLGVTIEFSCDQNVQIFAATSTVQCGMPISSAPLGQSGSETFTLTNTSLQPVSLTVSVVPAISSDQYDLTRARSATLTVLPRSWAPTPMVPSFTSSQPHIVSGAPFLLSWMTSNAAGANLMFNCADGIIVSTVSGTTTTPVPCNASIFPSALPPTGSTTIEVTEESSVSTITFTLLPENLDGTYSALSAGTLSLPILPAGSVVPASSPAPATVTTPSVPAAPLDQTQASTHAHYTFTRALRRGSRNADVSALQTFLAEDPTIYPEGLVTGYFGAGTLRALELFQEKYSIAAPGSAGFGLVGPRTRAVLNSVQ